MPTPLLHPLTRRRMHSSPFTQRSPQPTHSCANHWPIHDSSNHHQLRFTSTYHSTQPHDESIFIRFLKAGTNLEANVIAHELTRPLHDPQPLLQSNTAPNYTLQILIHTTPCHEDPRNWHFLTTQGFLTIVPKTLLPDPTTTKSTARLIADAHCILPLKSNTLPHNKQSQQKMPSTSYQHPEHHFYYHTTHFPSSLKITHPNLPLSSSPSSLPTVTPALEPPHTSSNSYNSSTSHRQDHVLLNATLLASSTKTSRRWVTMFGSMSSPA